jgi:O-antigen/teichoic acid export membrane protein
MSLRRIGKLFAAQNATQLITVLTQLLLPPAFLHAYGVSLYGQWLALSAALSYLTTFNYGLQTFTNMQMTIHYNRGELQETREAQSAGLRILLAALIIIGAALSVIFLIPLDSLLRLTIPQREAQWTLYILGCQVIAGMVNGFFSGSYMVIRMPHRGQNLNNINQLLILLVQVVLALRHSAFPLIAGAQLILTLLSSIFLFFDFSRLAPDIRPTLRYWKPGSLGATLKPTVHYMLLYSSNVLAYQLPTVLMQRLLGPGTVVLYSVTRTIYSMSRRLLAAITNSMGPEITIMFGQRNWQKLHRLYEFSERVILLITPPITFGSMLATPLLLQIWLHKGSLYTPGVCLLLGLTVSVLAIKEHKSQFQFSSNQQIQAFSYMTIIGYSAQLIASIPMMIKFGLIGYLITWLISEILQLFYLLKLNAKIFAGTVGVDRKPVYKLFAFLAAATLVFCWPVYHIASFSYVTQAAIAIVATAITAAISYWVFRVDEVRVLLWSKVAGRFPSLASRRG